MNKELKTLKDKLIWDLANWNELSNRQLMIGILDILKHIEKQENPTINPEK